MRRVGGAGRKLMQRILYHDAFVSFFRIDVKVISGYVLRRMAGLE